MNTFFEQLARLDPERRALLERKLEEHGLAPGLTESIPERPHQHAAPLSFAQQRLWFVQQFDPTDTAYNVACVLRLSGELDSEALRRAIAALIARHEILRTRFRLAPGKREPEQIIEAPPADALPLIEVTDADAANRHVAELTGTPFDLTRVPLRTALLRLGSRLHMLVLATHHIVSDRWSIGVFLREMTELYRTFRHGRAEALPPLTRQYADWAVWQRQTLEGEKLRTLNDFWSQQLTGATNDLQLPYSGRRQQRPTTESSVPLRLSVALSTALQELAQQRQVTLFTLLLTAFKLLLQRYSDSDDIVIGTDIANRERPETAHMIGLLVNTLVLRSNLGGDPSFHELLDRVRKTVLDALAHQALPFEQLVEKLNPERRTEQLTPLFQVKFDLQLATVKPVELDGLTVERLAPADRRAKYELRFNLQQNANIIEGQIEYCSEFFEPATIRRMAAHFSHLLSAIVERPEAPISLLTLMDAAERQQLLYGYNRTASVFPPVATLADLWHRQAEASPAAVALIDGQERLTYRELDRLADGIARRLIDAGARCETPVGICMPRSKRLIAGLLAILKTGACYVPLDPDYPAERLRFIAEDAGMPILLVDAAADNAPLSSLPHLVRVSVSDADQTSERIATAIGPAADTLAYIIYTSGSTGRPKGVAIEHRNAVAMLQWAQQEFDRGQLAGVLAATSICFDLSVFEIFLPLSYGGCVVIAEHLPALTQLPAASNVTLINTVPSVLTNLLAHGNLPESVRIVNLAGEALPPALLERLRSIEHIERVYNLYGPSEDTTYSTWARFEMDRPFPETATVPIGRPIANTQAYVLDRQGQPVPLDVIGELYLSGAGLARGYYNRPELTAAAFLPNAFATPDMPCPRLYRTGDRVRRRSNGQLEFLGRADDQIKIRGYRIETGEVDHVLRQHPQVREVIVAAQDVSGDRQLVAYLEIDGADAPDFRSFLQQRLPAYLVPTHFEIMSALPRLPNGKIDKNALPEPTLRASSKAPSPPRNAAEQALIEIWQEVLKCPHVGIHDNFFQLGGHSLMAIEIIARCEQSLACKLPLRVLFDAPTIAELASVVQQTSTSAGIENECTTLQADIAARHEPFALTDIQQAYLIGRNAAFELGNIATHGYREIEVSGLALTSVESVLNTLIKRHDMLRMVITDDNGQRVLAETPRYSITAHDLTDLTDSERKRQLAAVRSRLSHQQFDTHTWPLFQIEASVLNPQRLRFHLSFDVLIGDAWSFQLLGKEMAQCLQGEKLPELRMGFRDYIVAQQRFAESETYQRSLAYWRDRLDQLPAAPELPLTASLSQVDSPHFSRRSGKLDAAAWQRLQQRGGRHGLTPSAVVLTVFVETLGHYCRHPAFTLNLTLFNRQPIHPDINRVVGDFTASLLLAVQLQGGDSFIALARRVQSQLWRDMEHRAVSGVRIQRELAQRQGRSGGALMPVVFTSTLNQSTSPAGADAWQSEVVHAVSQTSQVYLDHQVSESRGELRFNWDVIETLFPEGMLERLCADHERRMHSLATCDDETLWSQPMDTQTLPQWAAALNRSRQSLYDGAQPLLHELFARSAARDGERPAILSAQRCLSYSELADEARQLCRELQQYGVQPNELVAVSISKGWQQVVAVLGILFAGAAYTPVDPELPRIRRETLLNDTQARLIVTTGNGPDNGPPTVTHLESVPGGRHHHDEEPARQTADNLAYVIYTSGSTGLPKGVMIDHRSAVNTILDINHRYGITAEDRVFGLSSLSFDLSVYDIFGSLAAGAALVLPDASTLRQPPQWLALLNRYRVTVWNSVPALMQLLVDACLQHCDESSLRLVMLSGDWIALTLPDAIRSRFSAATVISLGGATEASIWSIDFPIDAIEPDWRSIPYGRSLANQHWYVLDEFMRIRPPWAIGQLYIGGSGVALGYWRRPELTADRFVPNPFAAPAAAGDVLPETPNSSGGETLYRTGDLGRYRADGTIELLGREDHQVKINGYRIELGEIDNVLQQHPGIAAAATVVSGSPPNLNAFVVATTDAASTPGAVAKLDEQMAHGQPLAVADSDQAVVLPEPVRPPKLLQRQSHRRFLSRTLALESFSQWLSALHAWPIEQSPLPKYRYPSAGHLYPLQTYVEIRNDAIAGLAAGWYYYCPRQHRLQTVAASAPDSTLFGDNRQTYTQCAFALYFVAYLPPLRAAYGDGARDLSLLEAGYAAQLLMNSAPDHAFGLCPIGGASLSAVASVLPLNDDYQLLHGLLGGPIDPAWNEQWQILTTPSADNREQKLQAWLRERLPEYMVPARIRLLNSLPLTANGKIDRKALPTLEINQAAYRAPETSTEKRIAAIWQELLDLDRVGLDDDFFAAGGHSLLAMQLVARLRDEFNIEITLAQLFTALTPQDQARCIDQLKATAAGNDDAILPLSRNDEIDHLSEQQMDALLMQLIHEKDGES